MRVLVIQCKSSFNEDFRVNEYSIELIVHPQVLSKSVITLATFSSEML